MGKRYFLLPFHNRHECAVRECRRIWRWLRFLDISNGWLYDIKLRYFCAFYRWHLPSKIYLAGWKYLY
jgi:hypothetical protein